MTFENEKIKESIFLLKTLSAKKKEEVNYLKCRNWFHKNIKNKIIIHSVKMSMEKTLSLKKSFNWFSMIDSWKKIYEHES